MNYSKKTKDIFELISSFSFKNEDEYAAEFAGLLCENLDCEAATYFSADDNKKNLTFVWTFGPNAEDVRGVSFSYTGIAGFCAKNRKPLYVKDALNNPVFSDKVDHATKFKTKSVIAFPCVDADRLYGVIEFLNPKNKEYFEEEDFFFVENCVSYFKLFLYSKKLETTVSKVSERSDSAINNLSGGFIGADSLGSVIFFNRRAMEILEFKESQVGKNLSEIKLPQIMKDALNKTLKDFQEVKRAEFEALFSSVTKKIGYSVINLKTVDGEINGAGIIFQDITKS